MRSELSKAIENAWYKSEYSTDFDSFQEGFFAGAIYAHDWTNRNILKGDHHGPQQKRSGRTKNSRGKKCA